MRALSREWPLIPILHGHGVKALGAPAAIGGFIVAELILAPESLSPSSARTRRSAQCICCCSRDRKRHGPR